MISFVFMMILDNGVWKEMPVKLATGRIYFTVRRATVPTTFDAGTCKKLLNSQIKGEVERVDCEPYKYTVEDTGEVLELSHRWEFRDEDLEVLNRHVLKKTEKIK